MNEAELIAAFDRYTRKYFEARVAVIAEFSASITADNNALLSEVNADRARYDLPLIERPDYWQYMEDE